MAKLGIDFQEGFDGDEVIVKMNGRDLFHRTGVRTKRVLGLADSVELNADGGPLDIQIHVPNRGIEKSLQVDGDADVYLGVSLQDGELRTSVFDKPFDYA